MFSGDKGGKIRPDSGFLLATVMCFLKGERENIATESGILIPITCYSWWLTNLLLLVEAIVNNSCLLFESLSKSNIFPVSVKNVNIFVKWWRRAAESVGKQKAKLQDILVRKEVKGRQLESSLPTPALLSLLKKKWQSLSESNFYLKLELWNCLQSKSKRIWEHLGYFVDSVLRFLINIYFLSISSEAGLEIDSQQEEEPVQASDESDLPSTSQDPPSSSSVGKDCARAACIYPPCLQRCLPETQLSCPHSDL